MRIAVVIFILFAVACQPRLQNTTKVKSGKQVSSIETIEKTPEEWKSILTEFEYYVLRDKGTERAFSGEYWDNKKEGIYNCRACALPLFESATKFKSGTGWPSYYAPVKEENVIEDVDYNLGYARREILCARCDGHLGHVFPDGPEPTGLRYCVNSASIKFVEKSESN